MTGWLFFSIWIIFLTFFLSISHPMSVVFAAKWIHNTLISMNEKNQFPCLKYSIEFPFENCSFPLISLNRIHTYSLFNRLSLSSLNKPVAESLSIKFQLVYGFRTMEWRNEWVWWMKWSSFNRKLCNNEHTKKKNQIRIFWISKIVINLNRFVLTRSNSTILYINIYGLVKLW